MTTSLFSNTVFYFKRKSLCNSVSFKQSITVFSYKVTKNSCISKNVKKIHRKEELFEVMRTIRSNFMMSCFFLSRWFIKLPIIVLGACKTSSIFFSNSLQAPFFWVVRHQLQTYNSNHIVCLFMFHFFWIWRIYSI